MNNRITERMVAEAAERLKNQRLNEGKTTWASVEYYNGHCNLHEVNAETEASHCSIRHLTSGTKSECLQWLQAAAF